MSIEKGVNRIGTVFGIFFGIIGGFLELFVAQSWHWPRALFEKARPVGDANELAVALFIVVICFATGFLIWFYIVKGIFWVINWVIKGFKE